MVKGRKLFFRRRYPGATLWLRMRSSASGLMSRITRRVLVPIAGMLRSNLFSLLFLATFASVIVAGAVFAPPRVWEEEFWFARPEDVRTLVFLLASFGGAIIATVGIRLSHQRAIASLKQSQTSEEIFFTDLLVKAGSQLASDKPLLRVVGVNSVLRLALHSEEDRIAALNVLNQFLQDQLPFGPEEMKEAASEFDQVEKVYRTRGDVSAAARAISHITSIDNNESLEVLFRNSVFPTNAEFVYGLRRAGFENCYFRQHDLTGNVFESCRFSKVQLWDSQFNLTQFIDCEFSELWMWRQRFPTTLFRGCQFFNGRIHRTYFGRSTMIDCLFLETRFDRCDFHRVDFDKSRFTNCKFVECDVSGAYLAHLSVDDIQDTFVNCVYHDTNPPILPNRSSIESFGCFSAHQNATGSIADDIWTK